MLAKVKLIYIDPPYNTGNDGFGYNDRFNRASWLTFMCNRLDVARELLAENGAIYVNLDFNEVHYAKVLMDDIFGENNFQREIIWRIGWVSGYKTIDNNYIRNHDTILFYSKSPQLKFNKKHIPNLPPDACFIMVFSTGNGGIRQNPWTYMVQLAIGFTTSKIWMRRLSNNDNPNSICNSGWKEVSYH